MSILYFPLGLYEYMSPQEKWPHNLAHFFVYEPPIDLTSLLYYSDFTNYGIHAVAEEKAVNRASALKWRGMAKALHNTFYMPRHKCRG